MTDYKKLVEALRYCEFGWLARTCDNCEYSKTDCQLLLGDAADAIEELQSEIRQSMQRCAECGDELAQQLPKRGEWKATEMYMTDECTACGFLMNWDDVPAWLFNLPHFKDRCPNCGAKMNEEQNVE